MPSMTDSVSVELEHGFRMLDDPAFPLRADAVQLAHYLADVLPSGTRLCDLGCGAGAIALLTCAARTDISVSGVELRPNAAGLARQNAVLNGISERFTVVSGNVCEMRGLFPSASFSAVCANPPYRPVNAGRLPQNPETALACTELSASVSDFARAAAYLLPHGGDFFCVYPPDRLAFLLSAVQSAGLEPKTLLFLHSDAVHPACMVILQAKRGAKPGLSVLPPRFLNAPCASDSAESSVPSASST